MASRATGRGARDGARPRAARARPRRRPPRRSREGPPESSHLPRSASLRRGVIPRRGDRGRPPDGGSIRAWRGSRNAATTGLDAWRSRYESAPLRGGEVFTSISGAEVEPLATPETGRARLRARPRVPGRVPVHPRASIRRCTGGGSGRCGSSPGSGRRRRRTSASGTCSTTARRGSRARSTCRR